MDGVIYYKYNEKIKDNDSNYEEDYNQMDDLRIDDIDEDYWLASRRVYSNSNQSDGSIRYVDSRGNATYAQQMINMTRYGTHFTQSSTKGLRPVFHLKSGLKVTGGTGDEDDPYILK